MEIIEALLYGVLVGAILFGLKIVIDVISNKRDPKGDPTPPEFRPTPYAGPAVPDDPRDRRRDDHKAIKQDSSDDWSDLGYFDGR